MPIHYQTLIIATLMTCATASAQQVPRTDTLQNTSPILQNVDLVRRRIDLILDMRDDKSRISTDTLFLKRAPERLRLRLMGNFSGSDINVKGINGGNQYSSILKAQNKMTMSLSASYRGLTLGAALNPAHLAGKNKDYELNVNAYGNRMGADIIFQSANTFKGSIDTEHGQVNVPTGLVRMNMLRLNAYYAFNARRFSYPAAFSQSWIQLKSSGSIMAGLSFMGGNLRVRHSEEIGNTASRLSFSDVGLGIGYGYNWVIKNKWLLHLSTLPQIVVYSNDHVTTDDIREKTPNKFPNILAVGRLAVVRHYDRYYIGLTTVVNTWTSGDEDMQLLTTVKWRARIFVGIKLNRK